MKLLLKTVMKIWEDPPLKMIWIDVKALIEKGFINYYGLQRFGVTNVKNILWAIENNPKLKIKTHVVGKEVLKKNWKGAVELILSANDADVRADEVKKYVFVEEWRF